MSTTRLGSGLAFGARKDLELFSRMAARGQQLSGIGALGHGWTFTDAAPEQAIFALTHEAHPSPGYFDIFDAAGWTLVLSSGGTHIFKAAPGTPPVHTAEDSERDELRRQRNQFARYSAVTLMVLVLVAVGLSAVTWSVGVETAILVVCPWP